MPWFSLVELFASIIIMILVAPLVILALTGVVVVVGFVTMSVWAIYGLLENSSKMS